MNDEERIEHKPDGGKSRDWVGNFLADSACGTNLTHKFLKFYHQFILPNSILWKCFWTFIFSATNRYIPNGNSLQKLK